MTVTACVSNKVELRLAESSGERQSELESLIAQIDDHPVKSISWGHAQRRMNDKNLGLRQARKTVEDIEKQERRQWLSLVPRTAAFLNVSQSLNSLTNFDGDSINANIIANFNIPNPFEFYASLYANALQVQNARWSMELDRRRAFTDLYSSFLDARMLKEQEALLQNRVKRQSPKNSAEVDVMIAQLTSELANMSRRKLQHRGNLSRLFNSPGANWELSGTLPEICYRNRYRKLKVGDNFGKLALNLYAVRIEGAIMETQRVRFRQWPVISFGLSNPPLYSTSSSTGFSTDSFILFSGASKTFDVVDFGGRESIRDAAQRLEYTREQVRQGMESEALRMHQIRLAYAELLKEESILQARMNRLSRAGDASLATIVSDLSAYDDLKFRLIQIQRQIKQLDLQFVIWDERFWDN